MIDLSGRMALMIRWGCEIYPVEHGPGKKCDGAAFRAIHRGRNLDHRLARPDQPCTGFSSWLCTSRALAMLVLSS